MGKFIDLTGKQFGKLTVIRRGEDRPRSNGYPEVQWYCNCECGTKDKLIRGKSLRSGDAKSCGCSMYDKQNKRENLIGKRFGKLVVTRMGEDYISPKGRPLTQWYCDCDCGKKDKLIGGNSLKSGKIKSCGCLVREARSATMIDLTGQKFGRLTVTRRGEDYIPPNGKPEIRWYCDCDCGTKDKLIKGRVLRNGITRSCGCLHHDNHAGKIDITGQRFGRLTVVREKLPSEYPNGVRSIVQYYCDCDCGTKNHVVTGTYLRAGRVKSCGCYNRDMSRIANSKDITGQKFGKLTSLYQLSYHNGKSKSNLWKCICECGSEVEVTQNALYKGNTQSCGCMSSRAESIIGKFLTDHNIPFQSQYTFEDLRSPITGWLLKFDFAILGNDRNLRLLIEYDGEQHYYGVRFAPTKEENEEKFKRLKLYDGLKDEYCKEHNIKLLRIPYWDFDNIETILKDSLREKENENGISSKESKTRKNLC